MEEQGQGPGYHPADTFRGNSGNPFRRKAFAKWGREILAPHPPVLQGADQPGGQDDRQAFPNLPPFDQPLAGLALQVGGGCAYSAAAIEITDRQVAEAGIVDAVKITDRNCPDGDAEQAPGGLGFQQQCAALFEEAPQGLVCVGCRTGAGNPYRNFGGPGIVGSVQRMETDSDLPQQQFPFRLRCDDPHAQLHFKALFR